MKLRAHLKRYALKACFLFSILLPFCGAAFLTFRVYAASSPWTQTDWSGGGNQTAWSDGTKFQSSLQVDTSVSGELTLTDWNYYRKITFNNAAQAENLTDFPVLVKLNASRIDYSKTQNAGQDIRFVDADGVTQLPYEIEKWDEAGDSYVWVKVPQIDASSSTDHIYMLYGNAGASDAQSPSSVWGSDYKGVWHLSESGNGTAGEYNDSSSSNNDGRGGNGTATAVPTVTTSGAVGNAQSFDGGDWIAANDTNFPTGTADRTVSTWLNPTAFDGTREGFVFGSDGCGLRYETGIRAGGWVVAAVACAAVGTQDIPAAGNWIHVTTTFSGTTTDNIKMYINGVQKTISYQAGSTLALNTASPGNSEFGINPSRNAFFFLGSIDETRVQSVVRSAAWIAADYKSQTDALNTFGAEESSGTVTSSIFDSGFTAGAEWGTLTYGATTPANTSVSVKFRSSNSPTMTGATDFSACDAVASGVDITASNCVNDGERYIQYQVTLANTDGTSTPTFESISLAFTESDVTGPSLELSAPENNTYTNNVRPVFRWKKATDSHSGIMDYDLIIDNPSVGSSQPSGDFTISDIPVSQNTNYETSKYVVQYENFSDADTTNDYISVYTKSSSDWGASENNGELREGAVTWKVKATDSGGNFTEVSRTLYVDKTSPGIQVASINGTSFSGSNFLTTDRTLTLSGKIVDAVVGGDSGTTQSDSGPRVASGPQKVTMTIEKKQGLGYQLHTVYTFNVDSMKFVCSDATITDNTKQTCDKYAPFQFSSRESLEYGVYRVTLSGKDKVENGSDLTFHLQVTSAPTPTPTPSPTPSTTPLATTQPSPKPIEEVTKPVESLEVPKVEKITESISQTATSVVTPIVGVVADAAVFVKDQAKVVGTTIAQVATKTADAVSDVYQTVTQQYNKLADSSPGAVKEVLVGARVVASTTTKAVAKVGSATVSAVASVAKGTAHVTVAAGNLVKSAASSISNRTGVAITQFGHLFITEPTTIYDVTVVVLSPTSAKISWETNHPANGKVNYGLDATYPLDIQSEEQVTHHEFVLNDLQPGTTYHFEVMSHGKNYVYDANRQFVTPSEE